MNKEQKMTRTTELLKKIERLYDKMEVNGSVDTFPFGLKCYNKGRLDALKEEEIWFSKFNLNKLRNECEDENGVINAMVYGFYLWFRDRLASIQEEIKLIENAGVGK